MNCYAANHHPITYFIDKCIENLWINLSAFKSVYFIIIIMLNEVIKVLKSLQMSAINGKIH